MMPWTDTPRSWMGRDSRVWVRGAGHAVGYDDLFFKGDW